VREGERKNPFKVQVSVGRWMGGWIDGWYSEYENQGRNCTKSIQKGGMLQWRKTERKEKPF